MGEPIISPWIFYIAGVLHCFNAFVVVLMFLSVIFSIVCAVTINDNTAPNDVKESARIGLKRGVIIAVATIMSFIFVPSSTTYYQMVVANYVTYERVYEIKDSIESIFDKIIETAQELQQRR